MNITNRSTYIYKCLYVFLQELCHMLTTRSSNHGSTMSSSNCRHHSINITPLQERASPHVAEAEVVEGAAVEEGLEKSSHVPEPGLEAMIGLWNARRSCCW